MQSSQTVSRCLQALDIWPGISQARRPGAQPSETHTAEAPITCYFQSCFHRCDRPASGRQTHGGAGRLEKEQLSRLPNSCQRCRSGRAGPHEFSKSGWTLRMTLLNSFFSADAMAAQVLQLAMRSTRACCQTRLGADHQQRAARAEALIHGAEVSDTKRHGHHARRQRVLELYERSKRTSRPFLKQAPTQDGHVKASVSALQAPLLRIVAGVAAKQSRQQRASRVRALAWRFVDAPAWGGHARTCSL